MLLVGRGGVGDFFLHNIDFNIDYEKVNRGNPFGKYRASYVVFRYGAGCPFDSESGLLRQEWD
jgi:hypothetical protein